MTLSDHFKAHIDALERLASEGDEMSIRSLAAINLIHAGWRYGDPDPDDGGPDDDGGLPVPADGVVIQFNFRRAA